MPRKQSTRRSRKRTARKTAGKTAGRRTSRRTVGRRTDRRSTTSDTRRRTVRRLKGGVGLFEKLNIDPTKFSMTHPSRNYEQTRRMVREQGQMAVPQMAHPSRNNEETRRLVREQGQMAEIDELLSYNPQLPDDINQLIQMSPDELPSPMEDFGVPVSPVQNLDLPPMDELPEPMGVVERLADDRLSPEALMGILPDFDEEPLSGLLPMLKPKESLGIDFEGEAKLAEQALQWEEKTSRDAAKKKKSKGKKSEPRIKRTIGKNKSKAGVGTALAKKDKKKSDKQKKKKQEEALKHNAEREKRIKAREGRKTGGASSISLDSIPSYGENDLVSPRMQLPQPIQEHHAFDLPDPFPEPISPGDEIGLPMARHGDKSLMGELMKLNSESSGPSSEKQRLGRMKFQKLINEVTNGNKKPQTRYEYLSLQGVMNRQKEMAGEKERDRQNKKLMKPQNTIRKLAKDIPPVSELNFDPNPTGENVGRFRINRSNAMKRLKQKRRKQKANPTIRYKSRKKIADDRERVKGRFVKNDKKFTNQ